MKSNQKSTKDVELKCPICQTIKSINVPENVLSQKEFGTVKIQIPPGAVCEHQFLVFLDTKGIVRSYEKIDIQMAKSTNQTLKKATGTITLRTLIELFGTDGIFNLIHGVVFNYPSYIIIDEDFELSEELLNFIADRLLPEEYKGKKTIHLILGSDYDKVYSKLKLDKNALLMGTHKDILQTPWDGKLKFEEEMVNKALEIIDDEEQLYIIRNDIAKLVKEAEAVEKMLKNTEEVSEKELKRRLIRDLNISKISNYRLKLIKDFIKRHISAELILKIK